MALTDASDPQVDVRRRRTVVWVVGLATLGLIFGMVLAWGTPARAEPTPVP